MVRGRARPLESSTRGNNPGAPFSLGEADWIAADGLTSCPAQPGRSGGAKADATPAR
jgi:hypothetical protein